jgi:hypothetical protein|tara:strand:+ start:1105 stop:1302 length:198 start_codon:yes stop_codon:yes gene_type:complete
MILSKPDQIRKDLRDNPLKTAKDKKKFKKQVMDSVDDYLQYILTDFGDMTDRLKKVEKIISTTLE